MPQSGRNVASLHRIHTTPGEDNVFSELFQWDRFITPVIVKASFLTLVALICLHAILGIWRGHWAKQVRQKQSPEQTVHIAIPGNA
ncbi:MAG: hypothetical protein FWD68_19670 [Alphaproteobacteria bacterium]|nr:hypothetical protein [Alphaproteobacteria bacterium]